MKKILLFSSVLLAGIATAWSIGHFATQPQKQIQVRAHWTNVYRTMSGLVAGADLIVLAEHSYSEPGRVVGFGDEALPFTNNHFKIVRKFDGEFEGDELIVEQTGGNIGDNVFSLNDGGAYQPGVPYLLFLKSTETGYFYVINHQARYRLDDNLLEGVDPTDNLVARIHRTSLDKTGMNIMMRVREFKGQER